MVDWTKTKTLGQTAKLVMGFACVSLIAACSGAPVSRNAPFEVPYDVSAPSVPKEYVALPVQRAPSLPDRISSRYSVRNFTVNVPADLTVSEANLYYPIADIVWRGDPYGDRPTQIKAMFQNGYQQTAKRINGPQEVDVRIVLKRFHSLSEKTRYTVGGMHSITFALTIKDVETGAILVQRDRVKADLKGFGGKRAMEADRQGHTMKNRIQSHLSRVIWAEMTLPGGWTGQDRKLENALAQI
jgi:hypothetical protein